MFQDHVTLNLFQRGCCSAYISDGKCTLVASPPDTFLRTEKKCPMERDLLHSFILEFFKQESLPKLNSIIVKYLPFRKHMLYNIRELPFENTEMVNLKQHQAECEVFGGNHTVEALMVYWANEQSLLLWVSVSSLLVLTDKMAGYILTYLDADTLH